MITNKNINLSGQVAVVTGGGRGIGRAISLGLAKAGAKVAVAARSEDQLAETVALIEEAGGCAMAVPTDVSDREAVESLVTETEQHLGPVDLLVNNAGVTGPGGPMWETDPETWWQCINVNLRGPYLGARAVLPGMVERQQGRIITVASGAGMGPQPYVAAYGISKTAAIRFSETLALETKDHNISVFAIGPGFVRTAMSEYAAASPVDDMWLGGLFKNAFAEGHDTPPEHAADLVLLLASGQADALSGTFVGVYHDIDDLIQRAEEVQQENLYTLRLRT